MLAQGKPQPVEEKGTVTLLADATRIFIDHIKAHSPSKPKTPKRYQQVMNHFERLLGHRKYVEAISRADIDDSCWRCPILRWPASRCCWSCAPI
jgi:hypothetical protein